MWLTGLRAPINIQCVCVCAGVLSCSSLQCLHRMIDYTVFALLDVHLCLVDSTCSPMSVYTQDKRLSNFVK